MKEKKEKKQSICLHLFVPVSLHIHLSLWRDAAIGFIFHTNQLIQLTYIIFPTFYRFHQFNSTTVDTQQFEMMMAMTKNSLASPCPLNMLFSLFFFDLSFFLRRNYIFSLLSTTGSLILSILSVTFDIRCKRGSREMWRNKEAMIVDQLMRLYTETLSLSFPSKWTLLPLHNLKLSAHVKRLTCIISCFTWFHFIRYPSRLFHSRCLVSHTNDWPDASVSKKEREKLCR